MGALGLALILFGCCLCATAQDIGPYKDFIVDKHNEYRKMQKGSNMNKLVWSDEMAKHAERWVSYCNFEHEQKGFGENLAYNTGSDVKANLEQALQSWYDEIDDYNYDAKQCYMSCHYTQVVWAKTREVGCAMKRCPAFTAFGRSVENAWYLACWYDPKGNDMSEYPYDNKAAACANCLDGQTCEDGLCVGKGKEKPKKCEDDNGSCSTWANTGECQKNPDYMLKSCRKSCKEC